MRKRKRRTQRLSLFVWNHILILFHTSAIINGIDSVDACMVETSPEDKVPNIFIAQMVPITFAAHFTIHIIMLQVPPFYCMVLIKGGVLYAKKRRDSVMSPSSWKSVRQL